MSRGQESVTDKRKGAYQLNDAIKVREELDVHLERVLATEHLAQDSIGKDLAFRSLVIDGASF